MGKKQSRFECWWGEAKDEERKLEIPEYRKREGQSEANLATSKNMIRQHIDFTIVTSQIVNEKLSIVCARDGRNSRWSQGKS